MLYRFGAKSEALDDLRRRCNDRFGATPALSPNSVGGEGE